MADNVADLGPSTAPAPLGAGGARAPVRRSLALDYAAALAWVAAAVIVAFVVQHLIAAPNLSLVFVLAVVLTATSFGFGPALAAAIASVLAFDFFFTAPYLSLRIASPSDIWAASLLLVIAAIVSSVAADARQRAIQARREADRASALHDLAHLVVHDAPVAEVMRATAEALATIFHAPAVALIERDGGLEPAASTNGASLAAADLEAAGWSLTNLKPSHGQNYPFDASTFDFWPIRREGAPGIVLGVQSGDEDDRPEQPGKYVELAGAYLAASCSAPRAA